MEYILVLFLFVFLILLADIRKSMENTSKQITDLNNSFGIFAKKIEPENKENTKHS